MNTLTVDDLSELRLWMITVTVMIFISTIVFILQRVIGLFPDPIFELCIFHLPTIVAIIIYLKIKLGLSSKRDKDQ